MTPQEREKVVENLKKYIGHAVKVFSYGENWIMIPVLIQKSGPEILLVGLEFISKKKVGLFISSRYYDSESAISEIDRKEFFDALFSGKSDLDSMIKNLEDI